MNTRVDLATLLAEPERVRTVTDGERRALLEALAVQEGRCRLVRDLLTAPLLAAPILPIANRSGFGPDGSASEWMTVPHVASWMQLSQRTVRRRMHDGTWRKGEHWFQTGRARPRLRRAALSAWLETQDPPVHAVGLAYGPDIPEGRRRRLISLRNKCTSDPDGARIGAEAGRAAGRVPGASTANSALGGR
jgi:hypothetical protein